MADFHNALGIMEALLIQTSIVLSDNVHDRDLWAVDLVESSTLPHELKTGWWWATWPGRLELCFQICATKSAVKGYVREIEMLVRSETDVVEDPVTSIKPIDGSSEAAP